MKIGLNEQLVEVPERSTLMEVRGLFRPAADVWILNGAMVMEDMPLSEGDEVMLIERGVVPPKGRVGVGYGCTAYARGSCADESGYSWNCWFGWFGLSSGGGTSADGCGSASIGGF